MALTEQQRRENKLKNSLILFLIGYVFFAFIVLHSCAVYNTYEDFTLESIEQIEQFTNEVSLHMQSTPLFVPTVDDLQQFLFFSMFYFILTAYYLIHVLFLA
ncbi:MAG TPA: hypothetical protein GX532_02270 [Clostridia bacterium]|nr:hypothetical protein [Clostridia bacterium]